LVFSKSLFLDKTFVMTSRDDQLLKMRPEIAKAKILPGTSDEEKFQNEVLRPIAKLQNDVLVEVFKHYIIQRKNVFHTLGSTDKMDYMANAINKDSKLKKFIRGIFVGLFTLEELDYYQAQPSKINRRMHNLIRERLQSQVQVFDNQSKSEPL